VSTEHWLTFRVPAVLS